MKKVIVSCAVAAGLVVCAGAGAADLDGPQSATFATQQVSAQQPGKATVMMHSVEGYRDIADVGFDLTPFTVEGPMPPTGQRAAAGGELVYQSIADVGLFNGVTEGQVIGDDVWADYGDTTLNTYFVQVYGQSLTNLDVTFEIWEGELGSETAVAGTACTWTGLNTPPGGWVMTLECDVSTAGVTLPDVDPNGQITPDFWIMGTYTNVNGTTGPINTGPATVGHTEDFWWEDGALRWYGGSPFASNYGEVYTGAQCVVQCTGDVTDADAACPGVEANDGCVPVLDDPPGLERWQDLAAGFDGTICGWGSADDRVSCVDENDCLHECFSGGVGTGVYCMDVSDCNAGETCDPIDTCGTEEPGYCDNTVWTTPITDIDWYRVSVTDTNADGKIYISADLTSEFLGSVAITDADCADFPTVTIYDQVYASGCQSSHAWACVEVEPAGGTLEFGLLVTANSIFDDECLDEENALCGEADVYELVVATDDVCPNGACCSFVGTGFTCDDTGDLFACIDGGGYTFAEGLACTEPDVCPADNDVCDGAIEIDCDSSVIVDFSQYVLSPDETDPVFDCLAFGDPPAQGYRNAWYTFQATAPSVAVDTCASESAIDPILALYSGDCTGLTQLACSDGDFNNPDDEPCDNWKYPRICYDGLTVGQTYYVQIAMTDECELPDFVDLEIACPCPEISPTACCEYTGLCSNAAAACGDVLDCHALFPDDDDSQWRCTGTGCQLICDGLGADEPCTAAGLGACLPADYVCHEVLPSDCPGRGADPGTSCTPDPFSPNCGTGACCTPLDGTGCAEGFDEDFCFNSFSGTAFYEGMLCADPNPCLGACCQADGTCAELRESICVNNGGLFLGGETECPPDGCCPDVLPTYYGGDECSDAALAGMLSQGTPLEIWGDNWLASGPDSCDTLAPDPVWWETFTLTECSDVEISYCCTTADLVCIGGDDFGAVCTTDADCPGDPAGRCLPIMGTAYIVMYDACPCGDGNSYRFDDFPGPGGTTDENFSRSECPGGAAGDDPSPTIWWRNLPPGTYYYPIISDDNLSNAYHMTLTATLPTDSGECPSTAEFDHGESCADHNGTEVCIDLSLDNTDPRICAVTKLQAYFTDTVSTIDVDSIVCDVGGVYGGTATVTVNGTYVDIDLSAQLPDQDCCTVTLSGDASGSFTVRTLKGDVDLNGSTLGSDMLAVKPNIGGALAAATARFDVDCSGAILGSDMLAVKPYIGGSAPTCP